jgi:hypothetical protein
MMNTIQQTTKQYLALSFLILIMIGLVGCGNLEVGAMPADAPSANKSEDVTDTGAAKEDEESFNGIEIGIEPTPMPETLTYANNFYGFKFDYPETWTLKEKDHRVELKQGPNTLQINFRWGDEDFNYGRTGMAAGTPIYSDKIIFMREVIPQYTVELDHLAKYVIYSDTFLVEIDDLVFGIILEDTLTNYNELDLPDVVIAEAKTILESFERIEATGTPGESSPAPEAGVIIPVSPDPDWLLYTNADYDFGFYYPPDMSVVEEPNLVKVGRDSLQLLIAFRNIDEDVQIVEPMEFTGQTYPIEEIDFLARELRVFINSYDERVKAVYFGHIGLEQDDGSLVTAIHLRDTSVDDISTGAEIDERLIAEMTAIVKSFGRFETPSLPEVIHLDLGGDPIVAWLGHIASAPEGSRFDNMVVLSPQGTGQIGLTGATPEIEAEINSLRDAEGPNEYVHIWGTLLACTIDNYEKNNCELVVERIQSGANYSEEEVHDWLGTIKKSTFNDGESYVFEVWRQFPMWYGIDASQDESLQAKLAHFFETGERVEMSGLLMVGVPDVNGTRIEISSIQVLRGETRPDNLDSSVYENREYGFQFTYPAYMSVVEEPNKVIVTDETNCQMTIAYRRADENIQISDIGELTGQLANLYEVYFLGSFVQVVLNVQDGYITAAYLGEPGVELGEGTPLRFVIRIEKTEGDRLSNSQVDWMLMIFENFTLAS